jgi:hypothetical protein
MIAKNLRIDCKLQKLKISWHFAVNLEEIEKVYLINNIERKSERK